MKEKYTSLELIGLLVLGLVAGIPLAFYGAWCYLKIIEWYQIPVKLNIVQMFGIVQLVGLITYTESKDEKFSTLFSKLFSRAVLLSFLLFILYIIHLVV